MGDLSSSNQASKARKKSWQSWPWPLLYLPVWGQYLMHAFRRMNFTFPTSINASYMQHGGLLEASKWQMYQKTPAGLMPRSFPLVLGDSEAEWVQWLKERQLSIPVILKPDRGMRGKGIYKVHSAAEWPELKKCIAPEFNYLVQEFIDLPGEMGLFMIKRANHWQISSLAFKRSSQLKGNGQQSIDELLTQCKLRKHWRNTNYPLSYRPKTGEQIELNGLANHRLGAVISDERARIDEKLRRRATCLAESLPGFEYGRLDIKFRDWTAFLEGKDFKIIEVNGSNSEPLHIYDLRVGLLQAWRSLLWHHQQIFELSREHKGPALNNLQAFRLVRAYQNMMKLP